MLPTDSDPPSTVQVFLPAFFFAALCLLATPVLGPIMQTGLAMATTLTCMSQQFHAWAHMKASKLPAPVLALQVRCHAFVTAPALFVAAWHGCGSRRCGKGSGRAPEGAALQDAGLLVSRRAHGAHHRAPFEGNYCIVSGIWNHALDSSGFFRRLETFIAARTGIEPRCWHEPQYTWQEQ